MTSQLGMKRSFNFENLPSIIGLDQHAQVGEDSFPNLSRKRIKRQRTISTDLPSCTALCYCCEEEGERAMMPMMPAEFMPSSSAAASNAEPLTATATPSSSSVARLISPATSRAHVVVSSELAPPFQSEGVSSLPCFPSLRSRQASSDFPATAALEKFMLKQRYGTQSSSDDLDSDFSHSFEDEDDSYHNVWPQFDRPEAPGSPCQVGEFPGHAHGISLASRKSSSSSVVTTSSHETKPSFSFLPVASSCKVQPAKISVSKRSLPTVNQITEALAMIACREL